MCRIKFRQTVFWEGGRVDDDHGLGTKSLSIDEHDIVANETNHSGMHNAANGGDKIMIVHASTECTIWTKPVLMGSSRPEQ